MNGRTPWDALAELTQEGWEVQQVYVNPKQVDDEGKESKLASEEYLLRRAMKKPPRKIIPKSD